MIHAFYTWQASLTWRPALCFLVAGFVALCVVGLLVDALVRKIKASLERRAIRKRLWEAKQKLVLEQLSAQGEKQRRAADDAEFLRRLTIDVKRDRIQSQQERQQFHIPAAFRDMKGLHR